MFYCRSLALESRPKESSFMPKETWKDHVDQCLCKGANSTDRLLQGKENKARTINSWIPDFPDAHYEAENENEIGYKYSHSFSSAILSVSPQRIISEGLLPHDMHGLEGEFEANPAL